MRLNKLFPAPKSIKKRKRVGRGCSSGHGFTSGRGSKGQNARAGGGVKANFEGGQMPLYRRIPKRGFNNVFKKDYSIVNIEKLNMFNDGDIVSSKELISKGVIKKVVDGIKILAKGSLTKKLTIKANKFSQKAVREIESAGGKIEVV
ncbi:MAG: 50S ribosomal protein L15 [Candidatus Infernicultor aquiphilus]|jgi:large subunit ribosomal protein L15|uniref:Large ribosomal subunit protein uL15 n=1 Tax=Candidatus Infernicultor aquiphilus TaxID=1805029 RepID=A0A1J5GZ42_9BACT|nr:50S ribosomal protein L15 [bacterium]OIP74810.1 MAG: 50S ribosomal protein L15 [Candidatus Atribacteria bacterium CG2_30_33_13]PIU25700.1 MAG: 50S ribosomal protein L15 [Candidatus Atribacteria bacterium CG08_land_8_20_14_0_20_33_29]PIW12660.1 MAG: 50S ribosomal protein L15 [Candidatus Atribacteria bacterium CG17_big_fil_post_rev_8_21_14_2_50_34_11]PIX33469.1 MAG: 50S ribosomal protein L15 [Candidatus Atribacteria bacterium CG_4_8_14_3_um_filter_34_18]PIY32390.1 MAG: 50S ribosomal protein L